MTEKNPTVKPLFATVGAGDAVYAAVVDAVATVRERAASADVSGRVEEARERFANVPADFQAQFESLRERLAGLPSELPEDLAELREKFTPEELRRLADQYYRQALDLYQDLASRGEETVDRLRTNHLVEDRIEQVETLYTDARTRAESVIERVGDLIGRPVKDEAPAEEVLDAEVVAIVEPEPVVDETKAAPKKAPAAKKAPAKKAAPKKV